MKLVKASTIAPVNQADKALIALFWHLAPMTAIIMGNAPMGLAFATQDGRVRTVGPKRNVLVRLCQRIYQMVEARSALVLEFVSMADVIVIWAFLVMIVDCNQ